MSSCYGNKRTLSGKILFRVVNFSPEQDIQRELMPRKHKSGRKGKEVAIYRHQSANKALARNPQSLIAIEEESHTPSYSLLYFNGQQILSGALQFCVLEHKADFVFLGLNHYVRRGIYEA